MTEGHKLYVRVIVGEIVVELEQPSAIGIEPNNKALLSMLDAATEQIRERLLKELK